ncbi:BAI1-associated protein 3-like isoform X3 [Mercenaria mercenaria]|uniref:BAI1-associated protein 3-like isoform X3 n=1 Tax=Mercenaria mercenaria TaxID=6596 RepID=UPI00234EF39F|nr:BAI1-associated protein 3-like isoform X3 [Mercenaria mercenaria]XP_045213591.2 BAI1-associated protein 3-like isoform X3 [Mercenaria mercenaria]
MAAANQLQLPAQKGRHRPRQHHGQNGGVSKGSAGRVLNIPSSGNGSKYNPLPDEHQNLKVQESDGNFFENFTALSWRQENKRLRATNEDDRDSTKPPPSETQFVQKPKLPDLSRKEFELLYVEVLYTIKHKIGTTIGGHLPFIQDLYQYAQEAFKVSPEDHARLLAQATKEKPPIVILNATVLEARNLEAKDADGFSDPYCMLGIMPGHRIESLEGTEGGSMGSSDEENSGRSREKDKGNFRKFSLKKKSAALRDLLPAKYIQTTRVIPNTLNPVWNDKFRFDLEDVQTDRVHLDIWDHDDEFSVIEAAKKLNEIQGIKGLGRYFKQVAQSARTSKSSGNSVDDFLGCINISLDDIPSSGHEKWYQLQGRTSKSNVEGQIKLRLTLATREDRGIPEDDNWTDVRQHEDLISIFIEHEVRKCKEGSYRWHGELPQAAQTIIHQHAVQGDITPVQQAVCRWMAYSRKHFDHPLDYQLLLSLLQELDKLWEPTSLSREEEECLAESFTRFINHSLTLIKRQRDAFPVNNRQAMLRLDGMLQCLAEIYSLHVFKRTCPFHKELHPEITNVIKKSTLEWYERSHRRCRQHTHVDTEEDIIQGLLELTNLLNTDLHHAVIFYTKLYEQIVGVQYFRITYQIVEKMLSATVNTGLREEFGDEVNDDLQMTLSRLEKVDKDVSDQQSVVIIMGTQLFELYLALQEFCKFKEHLPNSIKKDLSICQYYQWFRFAVQKWLQIAKHKAYKRIHKAVELDKTVDVKSGVKYSTSAVDVCCCFSQMTEFWKNLDWPDLIDALPLVQQLTEDVCGGAVLYADLVHEKLRKAGYYDEDGQFDVTEQLCITINNIEQVRKSLSPMPEMLQFNEIQTALESYNVKNKSKYDLSKILSKADAQMIQKIKNVVDRVADKMRPDIKKDVFHLNWAPEAVPADDAIGDLLEYLDSNLLVLNTNLLKTNFDRILESIWIECLEEFREALDTEEAKPVFYQRMYDAIGLLVQFFNANDKGLPMQNIVCPLYKKVRQELSLHKMDTYSLIETFYQEKLDEQRQWTSTEYGALSVRVWYKRDSHTMLVEVLSAKDVIPLDANGLSDPYVVVSFCPEHMFANVPTQTTKIVKKTLNPVFDESFEFNVSLQQCQRKGAALVFTVMDHDYVFQNDFAGEVFMPLAEIPGVDGDEVTGYEALNVVTLPLMQPGRKKTGALAVLAKREWDKAAEDFVKLRSKVQEQSS